MIRELIIVFVKANVKTKPYLQPLSLGSFGRGDDQYVAGINKQFAGFVNNGNASEYFDIMFLIDAEIPPESMRYAALKTQSETVAGAFVFYHDGSAAIHANQRKTLEYLFGQKLKSARVEHHDRGPVFEALKRIAVSHNDKNLYDGALKDLLFLFVGDPELEAKLEILQFLLTPAGAKRVLESGDRYRAIMGTDGWNLIEPKARKFSDSQDPFDEGYIRELADLRENLKLDTTKTRASSA